MKNFLIKYKIDIISFLIWTLIALIIPFIAHFTNNLKWTYVLSTWGGILLGISCLWLISRFGLFSSFYVKSKKRRELKMLKKKLIAKEDLEWQDVKINEYEAKVKVKPKLIIYCSIVFSALLFIALAF